MTFSDRLKKLRKEKGLTQEQLAKEVNVDRSTVGKWEGKAGKHLPSDDVKCKLANLFGVSIDYLMGYVPEESAPPSGHELELSSDEAKLIDIYRALTQEGKSMLLNQADLLISSPSLREKSISAAAR